MKKRFAAFFLALIMILGMLPVSAAAAGEGGDEPVVPAVPAPTAEALAAAITGTTEGEPRMPITVRCVNASGAEAKKSYSVTAADITNIHLVHGEDNSPDYYAFEITPDRFIQAYNAETGYANNHTQTAPAGNLQW